MKNNKLQLSNLFVTFALLGFLVMWFIPYYNFEGEKYNLFQFIWWNAANMKKFIKDIYWSLLRELRNAAPLDQREDFNTAFINAVTLPLILSFVSAILAVVLNFLKSDSLGAELAGLFFGIYSTITLPGNNLLKIHPQGVPTETSSFLHPALYWVILGFVILADIALILRLIVYIPIFIEKIKKKSRKYR